MDEALVRFESVRPTLRGTAASRGQPPSVTEFTGIAVQYPYGGYLAALDVRTSTHGAI